MKKLKLLIVFILLFTVVFVTEKVNAASIVSGNEYNYTVTRNKDGHTIPMTEHGEGYAIFDLQGMRGTCIDPDVYADDSGSGKAVITKLASNNALTKILYYMVVLKDYANISNISSKNYYLFVKAAQYVKEPDKVLVHIRQKEGFTEADVQRFVTMMEEAQRVTVPAAFTAYKGTPTNEKQEFAVWDMKPFKANKKYATDTPSGMNNVPVKAGDTIKYTISWENGYETMTITDTLSKGLSYVAGSANLGEPTITNNSDGTTKLVWSTKVENGSLTYSAKVATDVQVNMVQNDASITVNNKPNKLTELKNPIPSKSYAPEPNDGYDHKKVEVGNDIKYQIVLTNVKKEAITVVVTDFLSKGLTYNKDASISSGTITKEDEPVINNQITTLKYTISLPANATAVLTYSAKVNSDAVEIVNNNAFAKYEDGSEIKLNELKNPVYIPEPKKVVPKQKEVIPLPDTASNVAILSIVTGVVLSGVGIYFLYTKFKKD